MAPKDCSAPAGVPQGWSEESTALKGEKQKKKPDKTKKTLQYHETSTNTCKVTSGFLGSAQENCED